MAPFSVIAAAALVLAVASPAAAQQAACAPHTDVVALLSQQHGEVMIGVGLDQRGVLTELFTSPGGATWSIIVTKPGGLACMVSAGTGWQEMAAPEPTFLQRPHDGDRAPNAKPIIIPAGGVEL